MAGRLKIVLRAAAVLVVVSLVALLASRVVEQEGGRGLDDALASGERPAAPPMSLETLDGESTVSLESLRGKAVVINFWASWCGPCKDEAPVLQSAWERHRERGVVVLGVDAQDFKTDGRRFAERYGLTYPLLFDGPGSTLGRWGVTGFPETWFVGRDGRLVGERIQGPVSEEALEENIKLALETEA